MTSDAGGKRSHDEERVLEVLEKWFLAEDSGERADLDVLCAGAPALRRRVESLLQLEPEALRSGESASASASPVTRPHDAPPPRLGDFRLIAEIGSGGMGTVYVAEQVSLGRRVAVKVLTPALEADTDARRRFQREAEIAATLDHPGIVPVYAVGREAERSFIAMKLLSGPGLDKVERPLPAERVARIGAEVARALDEAHLAGVVHRDVKPANILLDGERPYVVDFGLARGQSDQTLTRAGAVPGTLAYMAPEQTRPGLRGLDPRVDVYALGATLYELLSGRPPFESQSGPEELLRKILFQEPAPLRCAGRERDLETVLLRAIDKDPARRFQTAAEMAEDLERFLAGRPIRSRRAGPLSRAARTARRHPRVAGSVGFFTLLVVALLSVVSFQWRAEERRFELLLEQAAGPLQDGAPERALDLLLPHAEERGGDRRFDALLHEARARVALDDLLDTVVSRRNNISMVELEREVSAVETSGSASYEPRLARLALAFADFLRGANEDLGDLLGEWVDPPEDDGRARPAEEHLLYAIALRHTGASLLEQERELDRILATRPDMDRALYARAVALTSAGEHRRAKDILEQLGGRERVSTEVWRGLTRLSLALGDFRAARAHLDRLDRSEWSPVDHGHHLQLLYQLSEDDPGRERYREAIREALEAGRDDETLRVCGEAWIRLGDFSRARECLEEVLVGRDRINRELAAATLFWLDADRLGEAGYATDVEDTERQGVREDLVRRGEELLDEDLRYPRARAIVEWKTGMSQLALGDVWSCLRSLRAAVESDPSFVHPQLDLVTVIYNLHQARTVSGYLKAVLVQQARAEIARLRASEAHLWRLPSTSRAMLDLAEFTFAFDVEDTDGMQRLAPAMLELPEELKATLAPAFEEWVRAVLGELEAAHSQLGGE